MPQIQSLLKPVYPEINDGNSITQGLVFDAPFSEGAGLKSDDDVAPFGLEILGTIASATWDKNFYGTDLDFSAAASVVTFTTPASVNSLAKFSVEMLVYERSTGGGTLGRAMSKGVGTGEYFFISAIDSTHIRFQVPRSTTSGFWDVTTAVNTWYHYIVTYDTGNVSNVPIIYLNGVSQTLNPTQTPVGSLLSDTTALYIGNRSDSVRNWDGKISYARIWNRILTPSEVWALYTNPWRIYVKPNFTPYYTSPVISFPGGYPSWASQSISQPLNFDSAMSV